MSQQSQSFRTIGNVPTTLSANDLSINLTNTRLNAIIGAGAAPKNTTGKENTILGTQALLGNVIGNGMVAVGCLAASRLQSATGAVFVGDRAAPSLISATDSIFVGLLAGYNALSVDSCVVIGPNTGVGSPSVTIKDLVTIGSRAVLDGTGGTLVGARSSASGDACVCVGYSNFHQSVNGITVGSGCRNTCADSIMIGFGLGLGQEQEGGSNNLTIVAGAGTGRLNIQNALTGAVNPSTDTYDLQLVTPSGSITLVAPAGVVASGSLSAKALSTPSITVSPPAPASGPATTTSWNIALGPASQSAGTDLLLVSSNGTEVVFFDDFVPGILNFTAQHRCALLESPPPLPPGPPDCPPLRPGSVVIATGRYLGLDGSGEPSIDESVPIVAAACTAYDRRVFGVVSSHEEGGQRRLFRVGSLGFSLRRPEDDGLWSRATINAGGEGGILVCDANGPIVNGDLLVSSARRGLAMRQGDDVVRSCTVAKATCDCAFRGHDAGGAGVLIGCVYMC